MPTLSEAITAIRAGRLNEARAMLTRILAADGKNITALLWMTEVARTPEELRTYLERVLAIDPTNAPARRGLELLDKAIEQPPLVATGQLSPNQPASTNTASDHQRMSPDERKPQQALVATPAPDRTSTSEAKESKDRTILVLGSLVTVVGLLILVVVVYFGQASGSLINQDINSKPTKTVQPSPTIISATLTKYIEPTSTHQPANIDNDLTLVNWHCTQQAYPDSLLFEGTVKNVSQRTYSFVQIRVVVFDTAGNLLNTNTAYLESDLIYPNATSSFKASVDANGGTKCLAVIDSGTLEK